MLSKPITAKRRIISAFDPALQQVPSDVRLKYLTTARRDIAVLGDLSALPEQPVVWHINPVANEHKHLLDGDTWNQRWNLFAIAVDLVENEYLPFKWSETNGVRHLDNKHMSDIGTDIVDDIHGVIQDLAKADTSPFGLPAMYWDFEQSMNRVRAMAALDETSANKKNPPSPSSADAPPAAQDNPEST